nr:MAG TPA_asm: ribosome, girodazole, girolline, antibiotic complex, 50S [Caudoviricetes sp.]
MKEKEAIKILQELSLERCETFCFDCGNCDKCEVTIAYDMAIKALEKQIPKKAGSIYKGDYKCPSCKTLVGSSPYCRYCGQALDWG